jgi:N-acetylmuramoyl-L-alanine amidase
MANKSIIQRLHHTVLGIMLSAVPIASFAAPAHVTHIQLVNESGYVRVIFKIANPHQCDVFALFSPNRVVVDLEDGKLQADLAQLDLPTSIFKKVRSGTPESGVLRIVFDMAVVARVKSSLNSDSDQHEGTLFVDIYPQSAAAATQAAMKMEKAKPKMVMEQIPVQIVDKSEPLAKTAHSLDGSSNASEAAPPPPVKKPHVQAAEVHRVVEENSFKVSEALPPPVKKLHAPLLEAPKPHQLVIVIDAGHGGKDSGTVGRRGTQEKNVVLGIALRLAELVNEEPNMRAVLTRKGDYFVTLSDRLDISRNDKADLFVAIHADSYFNNQSTGASVYALSPHGASSVAARWLADRENHSELGGVDLNGLGDKSVVLRSVLIDLAQTATISDSITLGGNMLDSLENVTTLHYSQVEQAPFMVLKSPDIPSVLVETGFLSNPKEEERLREPGYRDKLARALLDGIRHYAAAHPVMASNVKT